MCHRHYVPGFQPGSVVILVLNSLFYFFFINFFFFFFLVQSSFTWTCQVLWHLMLNNATFIILLWVYCTLEEPLVWNIKVSDGTVIARDTGRNSAKKPNTGTSRRTDSLLSPSLPSSGAILQPFELALQ